MIQEQIEIGILLYMISLFKVFLKVNSCFHSCKRRRGSCLVCEKSVKIRHSSQLLSS
jgi:hypothetical protein